MRKEAAILLVILLVGAAHAQTYDIRFKTFPDKGKSFTVKVSDWMETAYTYRDADGKEAGNFKAGATITEDHTQTTLAAKGGRLEKFKREYTRAAISDGRKSKNLAFAGETINFTVRPKGGCATDIKAKLNDPERGRLADADGDGLELVTRLLPAEAVAEGGRWKIPGKQVAEAVRTLPVDAEKSRGIGRLVSVKKRGGKTIGTLLLQIELKSKPSKEAGKAEGTIEIKVEAPIDGSGTEAKVTITSSVKAEAETTRAEKKVTEHAQSKGELVITISEEK
jgi:hypothetical protein